MPMHTVKFWIGSLDRQQCKARAEAAGLPLIMEDTHYLYFRVQADSIRLAQNLLDAVEPSPDRAT